MSDRPKRATHVIISDVCQVNLKKTRVTGGPTYHERFDLEVLSAGGEVVHLVSINGTLNQDVDAKIDLNGALDVSDYHKAR